MKTMDPRVDNGGATRLLRALADSGLVDVVEMTALLELSRLTVPGLALGDWAQAVLDVIVQFLDLDGCLVTIDVPGVPPLRASFGTVPDEDELAAAVAGGSAVDEEGRQAHPLRVDGAVAGMLAGRSRPGPLAGTGFFATAAVQLSGALAVLVDAERLRRRAAVADALRLVGDLTSIEDDAAERLAAALAALPGAGGALVSVQPEGVALPLTFAAGLVDDSLPSTARIIDGGGTGAAVLVRWAAEPSPEEVATLDRVLDGLTASLTRAEERRRLEREVETDPLTGVGNRRRAARALSAALRRGWRFGESVAVVAIDLDHFKRVNDTLGHAVGDAVLAAVGQVLATECRAYDTPARMGGEEFLVILPACDTRDAAEVAARLRGQITAACAGLADELGGVTASAGVAVFPDAASTPDLLLQRADDALYAAKRGGRDRVVVAAA